MPRVDDSFLKSLILGRSSSVVLNPFFPFLYYRSLRFEACRWSKFSNQRDASYWTFQTIPFRISPNFYFFFSFSPLFSFSNAFLTNFFHHSRDLSKTRASYPWPHNFSATRSLDKCHVSDTLKKKYQFLRWPFAIGRARTRVGGVNRSTSLSTRNSSQFPVEEIERSAWSNPANWIPSLDGQKQRRVPSPGCFSPRSALFRRPLFLHVSRSVDSATVRFWVGHRLSKFQNASSSSLPPCLSLPLRSVSAVTPRYRRKSSPNELGSDRALYKVLTDVPSVIWELVTGGRRQRRDNEKVTDEWTEIIVVC